jgi:hypothetical protein
MKTLRSVRIGLKHNLIIATACMVFVACQKDVKHTENSFVETAKEWYYGTFKKSPEWNNSPLRGKKLPDWKHGIYKKAGSFEIAEYPLTSGKKSVLIPSTENLSTADKKRVAEATINRVAFIRKSGNAMVVREVSYVPSLRYLEEHRFDISQTTSFNYQNEFSGQIVVKNWKGDILSIKQLQDGKEFRKLSLVQPKRTGTEQQKDGFCGGPNDVWECEVVTTCDVTTYGDGMEVWDNCQSEMTDNCVPVYCEEPEEDPCTGLTDEECACQLYNICGGDDGGGGEEEENSCQQEFLNHPTQLSDGASTASEIVSEEVVAIDNLTKWKKPKWVCLKNLTWALFSQEEGQVELVDAQTNKWQWKNLEHKKITYSGTSYGGTVTPDDGVGTPSFTAGTQNILYAGMEVSFNVTYAPICNCPGVNLILPPYSIPYTAVQFSLPNPKSVHE